MQALKIHDGKLYHFVEQEWRPVSVEKTGDKYSHFERDLTSGGKYFRNVQVFDRYMAWRIPKDSYLGINRHFADGNRMVSPQFFCMNRGMLTNQTFTKTHQLQPYFTGQKELPNEVTTYKEPTDHGIVTRKFTGPENAQFHDLYFHVLRTPIEDAGEGDRRTLIITIDWSKVPDNMYFLYFPIYRTSEYTNTTPDWDMYYAVSHINGTISSNRHDIKHAIIKPTGKDDRCTITDISGEVLYGPDADPKIKRITKADAGDKALTVLMFDFPADRAGVNTMGGIAFDAYMPEEEVPYHRVPLRPFFENDLPPAAGNTLINIFPEQLFPPFLKQGDVLSVYKWSDTPEDGCYISERQLMCVGPVFDPSGGIDQDKNTRKQTWLFQVPGGRLNKVTVDDIASTTGHSAFYSWIKRK